MLKHEKRPARFQHAPEGAQAGNGVWHRAEGAGGEHLVKTLVGEGQLVDVHEFGVEVPRVRLDAGLGPFQHFRAEVYGGDGLTGRKGGDVQSRA